MENENMNVEPEVVSSEVVETQKPKANGMSIAGLVIGIVAIVLSCCCNGIFAAIVGIVGLVLSILGKKEQPCGLATAALVVSIIGTALGIVFFIVSLTPAYRNMYQNTLKQFYDLY